MTTKRSHSDDCNQFPMLNKKYVQILQDAVKRNNIHFIHSQEMKMQSAVHQIGKRLERSNNFLFMAQIVDLPEMNDVFNWHSMPHHPQRAYRFIHEVCCIVGKNRFLLQNDIVEKQSYSKSKFEHTIASLSNTKQNHVEAIENVRNTEQVISAIAAYYTKRQLVSIRDGHTKKVGVPYFILPCLICRFIAPLTRYTEQVKIGFLL